MGSLVCTVEQDSGSAASAARSTQALVCQLCPRGVWEGEIVTSTFNYATWPRDCDCTLLHSPATRTRLRSHVTQQRERLRVYFRLSWDTWDTVKNLIHMEFPVVRAETAPPESGEKQSIF